MKKSNCINDRLNFGILIMLSLLIYSCRSAEWDIPPELAGSWKTDLTTITVRTEPQRMKFQFTTDSAIVIVRVNNDKTVTGKVGQTEFKNGKMRKNSGNPEKTGVAYIIECGSIGKIFNEDPLDNKEVEIWLGPIKENIIRAELRYTEGLAQFPMAILSFSKENN